MEASSQLDSVGPSAASDHRSRRGPAVESVAEVLQPALPDKYVFYRNLPLPDGPSDSSIPVAAAEAAFATSFIPTSSSLPNSNASSS